MTEHRYTFDALSGDYIRAGAGILLCGGPLPFVAANATVVLVLGGLAALFALFAWRTFVRQRTRVSITDEEIAATGIGDTRLRWQTLHNVKLSYFSTRRDRRDGWMQLRLRGSDGKLRLDSSLQGFEAVARHAYDAALANGLELSIATLGNFQALGINAETSAADWGAPSSWNREAEQN